MAPNISVSMCTCKGHFWPARTRVIQQHPILQDANVKLLQQSSKQAENKGSSMLILCFPWSMRFLTVSQGHNTTHN